MIPRPDQNCQECSKPLGTTGFVIVQQFFFHAGCLKCRFCQKALTPAATDLICSLPFCLGHRGKEVSGNSSCPACDKKFAGITGKDLLLVHGAGYHKTCVVCADCRKSEKDGTPLDQFVASRKQLLCARCYDVRNPTKCAFCAKAFPKFDMSPGPQNGAFYCKGCFACASCTTKLKSGDKMFELSGKLFCANCEAKYQEAKYAVERMKTGP